jgi:hypothetical protein
MSEQNSIILTKKTKRGTDKKGRDTFTVYFSQEQAQVLLAEIQANVGNERGLKLAWFSEDREVPWSKQPEPSTFGFCNGIEAPGANYGKGGGGGSKYVSKPKPGVASPATKSAAARTLNTEVE